jgi:hypothetical protein
VQAAGLLHAYSGTACLDIDDLEKAIPDLLAHGISLMDLLYDAEAVQISSGTPNRAKLLYRMASPLPSKSFGSFELRCGTNGGLSVHDVLPPSQHVSGRTYQWVGNWRNLPEIPEDLLAFWQSEIQCPIAEPKSPSSGENTDTGNLEEIQRMVAHRNPDCGYDEWLRVGMAVHHGTGGSEEGFRIFDEWSAKGGKYKPGETRQKWDSFGNSANPVTINFLQKSDVADASEFETLPDSVPVSSPVSGVLCMEDVRAESVEWLWHPRIPIGNITMLEGDPGVGKSTICAKLAADISNGADGFLKGPILWLSAEDDPNTAMKPRLMAASADCDQIFVDPEPFDINTNGLNRLETLIQVFKPVAVIIDPIAAYLGETDTNADNKVRTILSPLRKIARKYRVAIICVRHLTKGSRDKAVYRGAGSIGFTAAARSVLLAGCSVKDNTQSGIVHIKSNSSKKAPPLGYEIKSCTVEGIETSVLAWIEKSQLQAEDILGAEMVEQGRSRTKLEDATQFLHQMLSTGRRSGKECEEEATRNGIAPATLRRAKENLGVKSLKHGKGWIWELPPAEPNSFTVESLQDDHTEGLDTLDKNTNQFASEITWSSSSGMPGIGRE